jgi:hypothetical protein
MQRAGSVSITVQPGLRVCHPALISVRSFRGNLPTPAGNAKLARSIPKICPIRAGAPWLENCPRWSKACAEKYGPLPGRTFKICTVLLTLSWRPADLQVLLKGDLHHMAAASRYPGTERGSCSSSHGATMEPRRPSLGSWRITDFFPDARRPKHAARPWGISLRQITSQRNR